MTTVYFRGYRNEVATLIRGVIAALTGTPNEHARAAESVHTVVGFAALSDIKDDYVRKARGEVGEDGVKWAPLTREYLAYGRRFGKGEAAALKRNAGLGPGHRHRGLLTAAQNRRWAQIYARSLSRFALSEDESDASSHAAAVAWTVLKSEGAKTKLEVFGDRQVEILRDTDVLFNSLSPGRLSGDGANVSYDKPSDDQVFETIESGVIVGTNVPYAKYHQGPRKNKRNERPFLPKRGVPRVWVARWLDAGRAAVSAVIRDVIVRAS